MRQSRLGVCCAAIILLAARAAPAAQALPPFDQFDAALQACAAGRNIALSPDLSASVRQIYNGQRGQGASGFADFATFLSGIPEKDRPEGYRLYDECITKILANTAVKPPPTTVTYRVCSGEYERSCQKHNAYLYCGDDVAAWARHRCTSSTVQRVSTYGGNKCGYSIDAVICAGPIPEAAAPKLRRTGPKLGSARPAARRTARKFASKCKSLIRALRRTGPEFGPAPSAVWSTDPNFVGKCKWLIRARRV